MRVSTFNATRIIGANSDYGGCNDPALSAPKCQSRCPLVSQTQLTQGYRRGKLGPDYCILGLKLTLNLRAETFRQ